MPVLEDKAGVNRLLGTVNYLMKFSPHLSDLTKPPRALLRNHTEFLWDSNLGKAFDSVKTVLTEAPVLKYFDGKQPILLRADASSQSGQGACLMQNGQPVDYASKALTPTECNYAQIEKELLPIMLGMNKFDTCFWPSYDHKPLKAIFSLYVWPQAIKSHLQVSTMHQSVCRLCCWNCNDTTLNLPTWRLQRWRLLIHLVEPTWR